MKITANGTESTSHRVSKAFGIKYNKLVALMFSLQWLKTFIATFMTDSYKKILKYFMFQKVWNKKLAENNTPIV